MENFDLTDVWHHRNEEIKCTPGLDVNHSSMLQESIIF